MSFSPVASSSMVSGSGLPLSSNFMDFGGENFAWYDRPLSLCVQRPQIRSSRISDGTSKAKIFVTASPFFARSSSKALACSTVLGKPSKTKPFAQSGFAILSAIMPQTISSETRPPDSMTAFACFPTSVPSATAARSISPVLSCGAPTFSTTFGACVPFPDPGGPKSITIVRAPAGATAGAAAGAAAGDELVQPMVEGRGARGVLRRLCGTAAFDE
mmetsp:Transcript_95271/g.275329  ORF Transcript_95271/g.275329 Transcript_95271/m.275329 type:complete len:216 (-) Transcript_95271:17-664(-)